jgi:hypothetical protein
MLNPAPALTFVLFGYHACARLLAYTLRPPLHSAEISVCGRGTQLVDIGIVNTLDPFKNVRVARVG